jgi:hypothetical protein
MAECGKRYPHGIRYCKCAVLIGAHKRRAYIAISRLLKYRTFSSTVVCESGELVSPWTDGKLKIGA